MKCIIFDQSQGQPMRPHSALRPPRRTVIVLALPLLLAACGGGGAIVKLVVPH